CARQARARLRSCLRGTSPCCKPRPRNATMRVHDELGDCISMGRSGYRKRVICAAAATLMLVLGPGTADAAEIHVWTARALATVLAEIGSRFERTTGHTLDIYTGLPGEFEKRFDAGDQPDLVIGTSSPVDQWIEEGRLV